MPQLIKNIIKSLKLSSLKKLKINMVFDGYSLNSKNYSKTYG